MTRRQRSRFKVLGAMACVSAPWLLLNAVSVLAQQEDNTPRSAEIPNPMGLHTWFIIAAIGAFLAWCISYSLQLQKEALQRRSGRETMLRRKSQYLEEIAELDSRKDAGTISEQSYRRRFNNLRIRLAKVLAELEENQDNSKV